jgi:long-subunit fatty acid transport protein
MLKKSQIWQIVIIAVIGVQIAQAQYAEDALRFSQFGSSVGARSQAMGNTNVGIADDFSALFGNPAGLSQQKSFEFSVGLSSYGYGNDVTFFGNKMTDKKSAINLNNLGIVYPIATVRGGLTFAFGFGRVANFTSVASFDGFNPTSSIVRSFKPFSYKGGTRDTLDLLTIPSLSDANDLLNNNTPFKLFLADTSNDYLYTILRDRVQQTARVLEGGGLNHWSFGGAIDIAKDISFGITLNFASGSYTYDREYTERDSRNVHNAFPDNFDYWTYVSTIESDLTGFNALFGFMYRKEGKYRFGMTLRTPTMYEISETFADDGTSHFDDDFSASAGSDSETKYKVITPTILSGGISIQPNDWLLLAGDAEYTDWTEMEFDSNNPDLIDENHYIKRNMRDTWNLRGGAEIMLWKLGLKLRGGIEWKPSPWKNDPAEYDQLNYTAGLGYLLDESSSINVSYALGSWNTFRNNYYWGNSPTSQTSEAVTTQTVNITFSYKF